MSLVTSPLFDQKPFTSNTTKKIQVQVEHIPFVEDYILLALYFDLII